jgi:hypothetical protein
MSAIGPKRTSTGVQVVPPGDRLALIGQVLAVSNARLQPTNCWQKLSRLNIHAPCKAVRKVGQTMDKLNYALADILKHCLTRKMVLPFIACAASLNGSILAVRYSAGEEGLDTEFLAQHSERNGFQTPITIIILDQAGEAVRVTIGAKAVRYHCESDGAEIATNRPEM